MKISIFSNSFKNDIFEKIYHKKVKNPYKNFFSKISFLHELAKIEIFKVTMKISIFSNSFKNDIFEKSIFGGIFHVLP